MTQYCPECHLVVFPHDSEKRYHFGVAYHVLCLAKYLVRISIQNKIGREIKRKGDEDEEC
jgi:hypothetical protein